MSRRAPLLPPRASGGKDKVQILWHLALQAKMQQKRSQPGQLPGPPEAKGGIGIADIGPQQNNCTVLDT